MAQTLVNIRMDEDLKKHGANLPRIGYEYDYSLYNFCKKMSREKRIPFEVSVAPFYSEGNIRALEESIEQLKQGKVVVKTIEELEGMANG